MQDLGQKQLAALVVRAREELGRGVDLDDFTLVHEDDTVGHLSGEARSRG